MRCTAFLIALAVSILSFPALSAAAEDPNMRVGITWSAPSSCAVNADLGSAFVVAYSAANDMATVAAGKALIASLWSCAKVFAAKMEVERKANFGVVIDYKLTESFSSPILAIAQISLISMNAAIRLKDFDSAKTVYTLLHTAPDMGAETYQKDLEAIDRIGTLHSHSIPSM